MVKDEISEKNLTDTISSLMRIMVEVRVLASITKEETTIFTIKEHNDVFTNLIDALLGTEEGV